MIPTPATLLAFDFGMRKIGVAVGQSVTKTAEPLTPLKAQDGIPEWDQIDALIKEWQVAALVVGLPLNMDGSEQHIMFAAQKFARRLEHKFKLPVFLNDERLTTKEAQRILVERNDRKTSVDSFAAVLILESWMREHSNELT